MDPVVARRHPDGASVANERACGRGSNRSEEVHLPRVRATGGTAAPARGSAAELLRSRGAQRADRASGTPAPRARVAATREQRPGGSVMANEAYRAVFLRVHPT